MYHLPRKWVRKNAPSTVSVSRIGSVMERPPFTIMTIAANETGGAQSESTAMVQGNDESYPFISSKSSRTTTFSSKG